MKNLIKIIAILTTLTMTACGASDLAAKAGDLITEALEAARLLTATRQIEIEARDAFIRNLDPNLTLPERAEAIQVEADRRANLPEDEKAALERDIQNRVEYLKTVEGLSQEKRDANLRECQADDSGEGCAIVLLTFCTATPFDANCISNIAYDLVRAPACVEDKTTNDCTGTIARVCAGNPFGDLCADDSNYNTQRRTACLTETTSERCKPTVDRICSGNSANIYDAVCNGTSYADDRLSIDDSVAEILSRDCANIRGDSRCATIVAFVCERQPLNAVCDDLGLYSAARRAECLTGVKTRDDCKTTVSQVCSANSLDSLCVGIDAYASLQAAACRGESATSKPECTATLTRVCGNLEGTSATGDPFSLTCRNAAFQPAREAVELACVTTTDGRLCQAVRDNTCATTPFDPVCAGDDKYLPLQIRGCIGQEATGDCVSETFFTNSVIRGCLADPLDVACTASGSAFKPYQIIAQDVACLANGVLANCANPTAVFPTLPTTLLQVLTDTSQPYDATTNPYTGGVIADPTMPHHISTNPYISGFITIDADDLDENGNLIPPGVEGSNFQFVTTGGTTHNVLGLNVRGGGAGPEFPDPIPGGAVTIRRGGAGSDNDDGVAYFSTTSSPDEAPAVSYGGILPTTNLGAPLLPQPAVEGNNVTAIWDGHVSYRQNPFTQNRVTNFYVDFTAGTINFANTAGDGATSVGAKVKSSATRLRLNGKFGEAHGLALGQLGGTVEYIFALISQVPPGPDAVPNESSFQVHGLIGQEGVVGVFTNPLARTGNSLIGGFTASNPDHPNNQ